MYHDPVMVGEVLEALRLGPDSRVLDCNLGGGGHSEAILRQLQGQGQLLALDCDEQALHFASQRLAQWHNFRCYRANFGELSALRDTPGEEVLRGGFSAIVMDLGVSSAQLDRPERGFSFRWDAPLDMRMDDRLETTAADLLRELEEYELYRIFRDYGEETKARQVARAIVQDRGQRPFETTGQLSELVARIVGKGNRHLNPATKVFQALRIAVNDELGQLRRGLESLLELLAPGGHWAILTYHSLEDRIVKNFFRDQLGRCVCPRHLPVCVCNPKARLKIPPGGARSASEAEIERNPRSRSAKLRIAEKVGE